MIKRLITRKTRFSIIKKTAIRRARGCWPLGNDNVRIAMAIAKIIPITPKSK